MLDDLTAFRVDVADKIKHLELKLLWTDVHDFINSMDLVSIFLASSQELVFLSQLSSMFLDDLLNFFLFSKDFHLQLRLLHSF